jgi:hypothetical protein
MQCNPPSSIYLRLAGIPWMSYTRSPSPTVVFLPLSGGNSGSRINPEVSLPVAREQKDQLDPTVRSLLLAGRSHSVATVSEKTGVCR